MSWYQAAAEITEQYDGNTRYTPQAFARVLSGYDSVDKGTLEASELAVLLERMMARYGVKTSVREARQIIKAFGFTDGVSLETFAQAVVQARGQGAETYTRLLANMLAQVEDQRCAVTNPFAPSEPLHAAVQADTCKGRDQQKGKTETSQAVVSAEKPSETGSSVTTIQKNQPANPKTGVSAEVAPVPAPPPELKETFTVQEPPAGAEMTLPDADADPFAAFGTGKVLTHKETMTPLGVYEQVMKEGGCKEHCDVGDVELVNAEMKAKTGRDFEPFFHGPMASDAQDVRTAVALGAPYWAVNELEEIPETLMDMGRPYNPSYVLTRDHFFQSPLFGEAKGYASAKKDPNLYLDYGDHLETHTPDPLSNMAALVVEDGEVALTGAYNLYRREDGSAVASGRKGLTPGLAADAPDYLRLDAFQSINKTNTRAVGGTALISTPTPDAANDASGGQGADLYLNPMLFNTGLNKTWAVGPYLQHSQGQMDYGLAIDASKLMYKGGRIGQRTLTKLGSDGLKLSTTIATETHVFSRPTGEFTFTYENPDILSSGPREYDTYSISAAIAPPLSYRDGLRSEFAYSDHMAPNGLNTLDIGVGYLRAFGDQSRLTASYMQDLSLQSYDSGFSNGFGNADITYGHTLGVRYFHPKLDLGVITDVGVDIIPGSGVTPTFNLKVMKVLDPNP